MKKFTHQLIITSLMIIVSTVLVICTKTIHAQVQEKTIIPEGMNMPSRVPAGTIPMSSMDLTKNHDFTGNVSIPIPLVSFGGVDVQLKYYSKGIANSVKTENQYAPSGPVGIGWQLAYGSISAEINNTIDTTDDKYYYNGPDESFEIHEGADGTFYIPDYKPWKIKRVMDGNKIAGWIIIKGDGTIFRFGNYHRLNNGGSFSISNDSTYATRFLLGTNGVVTNTSQGSYNNMEYIPYQWDISNIQDVNGNQTTIKYQPVLKSLTFNGHSTGAMQYTSESYPDQILDNRGGEINFVLGTMESNEYYNYPQTYTQNMFGTKFIDYINIKGNGTLFKKIDLVYDSQNYFGVGVVKKYLTEIKFMDAVGNALPSYKFDYYTSPSDVNPGAIKSFMDPGGGKVTYTYSLQQLGNVNLSKKENFPGIIYYDPIDDAPMDEGLIGKDFVIVHGDDNTLHVYRQGVNGWHPDNTFPFLSSTYIKVVNDYVVIYSDNEQNTYAVKRTAGGWRSYNVDNAIIQTGKTIVNNTLYVVGEGQNYFVVKYNMEGDLLDFSSWDVSVINFTPNGLLVQNLPGRYDEKYIIDTHPENPEYPYKRHVAMRAFCGQNYFVLASLDSAGFNQFGTRFSHYSYSSNTKTWLSISNRELQYPENIGSDLNKYYPHRVYFGKNFILLALNEATSEGRNYITRVKVYSRDITVSAPIDTFSMDWDQGFEDIYKFVVADDYYAYTYDSNRYSDDTANEIKIKNWTGSGFVTTDLNMYQLFGATLPDNLDITAMGNRLVVNWMDFSDYKWKMGYTTYSPSTGQWNPGVVKHSRQPYYDAAPHGSVLNQNTFIEMSYTTDFYNPNSIALYAYQFFGDSLTVSKIDSFETYHYMPRHWVWQTNGNTFAISLMGSDSIIDDSLNIYTMNTLPNGSMEFNGNPTSVVVSQKTISAGMGNNIVHSYAFQDGIMNEYGTPEYGNVTDTIPGGNGSIKTYYYTSKDSTVSEINYKNLSGLPYDIKEYNNADNVVRRAQKKWLTVSIDPTNGVYFKELLSESITTDGIEKVTSYTYDDAPYFQVRSVSETNNDGTVRKTSMTYPQNYDNTSGSTDAFVQAIDSMKNSKHICNAVIEKTVANNSDGSVYSGEITEYKLFNDSQILPWKKYGLKSTANDVISDFTSSSASTSSFSIDSRYLLLQSFDSYDIYGNPLQTTDANGNSSTYKYGYNNTRMTSEIKNAVDGECGFIGLEDGWNDWETGNSSISSNIARTGLKSSLSNNDFGPTRNFYVADGIDKNKTYTFEAWIYKISGTATITIEMRDGANQGLFSKNAVSSGANGWELVSVNISPQEMSTLPIDGYLRVWCGFEGTGNSGYVDDLRFYPEDAAMVTMTYDPASLLITSKSNENNNPVYLEYDGFGRPTQVYKTIDGAKTLTGGLSYSYSRDTYLEFNSSLPNSKTTILYDGTGNNTQTKEFFDGLNRPIQQQFKNGSNTIVSSSTTYDLNNRIDKTYKAYESTSTFGQYDPNFAQNADSYCGNTDGHPYSQISYYADPLDRSYKQSFPGAAWAMGSGHEKTMVYSSGSGLRSPLSYAYLMETAFDEQQVKSQTYKDNFGRMIASIQDPDNLHYETDFEYNLNDKMTKSTDPSGKQTSYIYNTLGQLIQKTSPDAGTVQYLYDKVGNLRFTKDANHSGSSNWYNTGAQNVVGVQTIKGNTFTLYMPAVVTLTAQLTNSAGGGQMIKLKIKNDDWSSAALGTVTADLSNTSASKTIRLPKGDYYYEVETDGTASSQFQFTVNATNNLEFTYKKYDALNRIIEEGEYNSTSTNGFNISNAENANFPTSGRSLTAEYYYDDEAVEPLFGTLSISQNNLKGRLSSSKSHELSELNISIYYSYNETGNVEWLLSKHADNFYTMINYYYDLQGKVVKEQTTGPDASYTLFKFYEYDQTGRLTNVITSETDNKNSGKTEAHYDYLADGSVKRLELGTNVQGVDYAYNPRGWLTQINHQNLNAGQDPGHDGDSTSSFKVDKFGEIIGYNTQENIGDPTYQNAAPQYNGNIGWIIYQMSTAETNGHLVGWTYNYDNVNRLTKADYGYWSDNPQGWQIIPAYDLGSVNYDNAGNITGLARNRLLTPMAEDLTYDYIGGTNKLNYVTGPGSFFFTGNENYYSLPSLKSPLLIQGNVILKPGFSSSPGQKVYVSPNMNVNYDYDNNGNMIRDLSNSIAFILYDTHNLPVKVYGTDGTVLSYVYDTDGNRISTRDNNRDGFNYVYGANAQCALRTKIANGSAAEVIHNLWGNDIIGTYSVASTTKARYYFLKDHLGSVKVRVDEQATIVGYNDYDPFGLMMDARNYSYKDENYKYTGKEYDAETGYYCYGARSYMSWVGRWPVVDPMFEKYPGVSSYAYVLNNPMKYIDPKGMFSMNYTLNGIETNYDTWNSMVEAQDFGEDEKEKRSKEEKKKEQPKQSELNTASQTSIVLNALGITFEAQNAIINLAGELDAGTAKIVSGMKDVGRFTGFANVLIDASNLIDEPSFENAAKLGTSTAITFTKVNPWIAVGVGIADVTGISKPVYKAIGNIPASLNNTFKQMYLDMNRQLIPRGF